VLLHYGLEAGRRGHCLAAIADGQVTLGVQADRTAAHGVDVSWGARSALAQCKDTLMKKTPLLIAAVACTLATVLVHPRTCAHNSGSS
jgi:hypothetical protein